jgi:REP element-mobilizing transposase RayT
MFLEKIPRIHPNYIVPVWVVMPNHIHAIIAIDETSKSYVETPHWGVSTTKSWR